MAGRRKLGSASLKTGRLIWPCLAGERGPDGRGKWPYAEYIIKMIKQQITYHSFWALKNVSFEVKKGDTLGLIGLNGSGKSTILKIIAGILRPTQGTVKVKGKIAPLIELGAGFDGDLTGEENVYLNGALLGYSQSEMFK